LYDLRFSSGSNAIIIRPAGSQSMSTQKSRATYKVLLEGLPQAKLEIPGALPGKIAFTAVEPQPVHLSLVVYAASVSIVTVMDEAIAPSELCRQLGTHPELRWHSAASVEAGEASLTFVISCSRDALLETDGSCDFMIPLSLLISEKHG